MIKVFGPETINNTVPIIGKKGHKPGKLSSSLITKKPTVRKNIPTSEDYNGNVSTTGPRACYDESKRFGETIIKALNDNGYRAYSARISLAYGPGIFMSDERVINQFIIKALNNKINLLDSGKALRTYCYITDISKTDIAVKFRSLLRTY